MGTASLRPQRSSTTYVAWPPTRPRPGRSPLRLLQHALRGRGHEIVPFTFDNRAYAVDPLGDLLRGMAHNVFPKGGAEHGAARSLGAPGQSFDLVEYVIGNGYRRFHTMSITPLTAIAKAWTRKTRAPPTRRICGISFGR